MEKQQGACLICGKPLRYFTTEHSMTCVSCGKTFMSNASCEDGHYICDACHAKRGIESIMEYCRKSKSINPIEMVQEMMDCPYIHMHGNEHHVMVGAALITAYHNAGGDIKLESALEKMKSRGSKYPGGACGFWGCCGAAVSTGMFLSIVTGTTPISGKSWGMANKLTSKALENIGGLYGPRCCKRNSFTAIITAVKFLKDNYSINLELPEKVKCHYFPRNKQCKGTACPYFPAH